MVSNENGTELDTYSQVAFATKVQAGFLCGINAWKHFAVPLKRKVIFTDLDQLLDQDTLQAAGQKGTGKSHSGFKLSSKEEFGVEYEPVCVAVLVNAQNTKRFQSG